MQRRRAKVVLIAGPNGAGKSTLAPTLLRDTLRVTEFVNADVIARGLSAFASEDQAIASGRIMLERLRELAAHGIDFAFESTLASRGFARWIAQLVSRGDYDFHLLFLWLHSPEIALARVRARAAVGGHSVPEDVVRRRHERGVGNFFALYMRLAKTWRFYDNSGAKKKLVARGGTGVSERIYDARAWTQIREAHG